jgi:hypothetical protein
MSDYDPNELLLVCDSIMEDGATSFLPIACTDFEYFLRSGCVGHACLTIHPALTRVFYMALKLFPQLGAQA